MLTRIKNTLSNPMTPKLIALMLLILILWQIILSILTISNDDKEKDASRVSFDQRDATMDAPELTEQTLSPFFGEYVPETLDGTNIRQSMLDLKVVGVIFSEQEANSKVIIQSANDMEMILGVGDALPGGVVIKRITSEGVLLGRDGTLERLDLPKQELNFDKPAEPLDVNRP